MLRNTDHADEKHDRWVVVAPMRYRPVGADTQVGRYGRDELIG